MCMSMDSVQEMPSSMMFGMSAFFGVGLALGLAFLAGTFYLLWRLVRALEKRMDTP
jgi:hypothetical protein